MSKVSTHRPSFVQFLGHKGGSGHEGRQINSKGITRREAEAKEEKT